MTTPKGEWTATLDLRALAAMRVAISHQGTKALAKWDEKFPCVRTERDLIKHLTANSVRDAA